MKKFCDIQSRNELADYLGIPRSKLTHILYVKKPDSYYTTLKFQNVMVTLVPSALLLVI